ncbi:ribonuclease P protein component [Jannaschia sp. W003]|uniref:ribonuclease P protein component n=1 Tax=Jannaschia sp. W003 TaxID=2867012 RepID=UPI0038FCFBC3
MPAGSMLLQARDRGDGDAGIGVGFTCSKKVGNAVARNRAKRRLREAARVVLGGLGRPGWDYVLVGRRDATALRPWDDLLDDLRRAVRRAHR